MPTNLPFGLQLAGFIVSIVALVLAITALPTVVQMICGRPKLRLATDTGKLNGFLVLEGLIRSEPINRGLLAFLRVKRETAEDVWARFEITRHDNQMSVFSAVAVVNTYSGAAGQRVTLPASAIPGTFAIALIDENEGTVYPGLEMKTGINALKPGLYEVLITIHMAGQKKIETQKQFFVQPQPPFADWVSP